MALAEVLRITHSVRNEVKVVDDKVQVVIDDSKEARVAATEATSIIQQTANNIDEIKWNQLIQLLRAWLSPSDPSTNHNIARRAQHQGTAVWFFQGSIFIEWKSIGSLLWIHGKPGSGKSVICSSVIQNIMAACEAGLAVMAYFYFDFRDLNKQSCHDLLLSLVAQLSTRSSFFCDILHHVYKTHESGTRQPSDETLKECLKEMLRLPGQGPIFIVLDALDECPDSSGIPSPRSGVLQLVKELVDLDLRELRICVTSRPEVDIRSVLEPLAFRSVSLHNEGGQKADIADYVQNIVNSSLSTAMRRWREDDRNLVIKTLTDRADGMFRWVFCQLETLQHCFPPNLRQFLNEMPETLDETYERILKSINKAQKNDAYRLLQCLTVAVRPLRVEELAELLAFDFQASSSGGIPKLKDDWRWDDQEEAVLSTCSSLITVVPYGDSQVVQFSHFSVKEYLTSPRLAQSHGDVSRFHIDLERAHTVMAQGCLGTLLLPDEQAGNDGAKVLPLVAYAAQHWVEHARFEKVTSRVQNGMDDLFDNSKPHFAAWLRVYDVDMHWESFSPWQPDHDGSPLYYAAFCGFYDTAERLIMMHPEQVNAAGGRILAPLPTALSQKHFRIANLLHKHGAVVDVRGLRERTPLHAASMYGRVDIMQWLLDHGEDVNTRQVNRWTPLHLAARNMHLEAVQLLLDHNADINSQGDGGTTPLYEALSYVVFSPKEKTVDVDVVRKLLQHGADTNIHDHNHSTPLHRASSQGWPEVSRLLLSHGAIVDEKDKNGKTPFQVASANGHVEITKLLLDHGATGKPDP
ncbi:ankyrin repeat-containing domain protein [Lactarius deliciosus]|nr:ankyrin repeat-containing domain protein [Lactarius deliciosus]